ncbi:MAG: transposase [Bacteroidales bacterium]|nr:transposase [Bacteroidales bacterium]
MRIHTEICFPKTDLVTDRFHVQKLAREAVQDMRLQYRWEALDKETKLTK